eukprot:1591077-Pyramimonas_sp.AAC.1
MPCFLCLGRPLRIAAAVRDHLLRTPYGVENYHACHALQARNGWGDHPNAPPVVSRKCHACRVLRPWQA